MILDDRTTNGEPNAHSAALCRVERVEQSVSALPFDARSGILYRYAHDVVVLLRSDRQQSRTIVDVAHRLNGISKQIQDDLLKLDSIPAHRREIIGKLKAQYDTASLQF